MVPGKVFGRPGRSIDEVRGRGATAAQWNSRLFGLTWAGPGQTGWRAARRSFQAPWRCGRRPSRTGSAPSDGWRRGGRYQRLQTAGRLASISLYFPETLTSDNVSFTALHSWNNTLVRWSLRVRVQKCCYSWKSTTWTAIEDFNSSGDDKATLDLAFDSLWSTDILITKFSVPRRDMRYEQFHLTVRSVIWNTTFNLGSLSDYFLFFYWEKGVLNFHGSFVSYHTCAIFIRKI